MLTIAIMAAVAVVVVARVAEVVANDREGG